MAWAIYNGRGHRRDFPAATGINVYGHEDGTFTVARNQMWWPGVYATHRAAALATRVDPALVEQAWNATPAGCFLTEAEVKALIAEGGAS